MSTRSDDQPSASTGSAMTQTMREPPGPSRRTFRLSRVWERGSASLYAGEAFLSRSE